MRLSTIVASVVIAAALAAGPAAAQETPTDVAPPSEGKFIPDYQLPTNISLCGETMPLDNWDVYERMDYEFLLAAHSRLQVFLWMRRAARYFPYIEKKLAEAGLPDDLKYLAVAESDLRPSVSSTASAVGVWQFMKFTGKKYGLQTDNTMDERRHFERSTEAALKYLERLHSMFGKWSLAMAAYNCGEGCVGKAVKEQDVNDYFRLDLPNETERYVYRIAAIKLILENPRKYGYDMDPGLAYAPIERDTVSVSLNKEVHITRAAKAIGTDYKVIKELNPWILGSSLPQGSYRVYVPKGMGDKMSAFLGTPAAGEQTKSGASKSVSATGPASSEGVYVVKPGDSLNQIAGKTGVPLDTLRRLNNIKGDILWVGQKIRLN